MIKEKLMGKIRIKVWKFVRGILKKSLLICGFGVRQLLLKRFKN